MKLTESILEDYAKKILGFAYEKTGNYYDAEELAQEIMVQLLDCMAKKREVEHLSSFVYTVCCYTWSKYLRSNRKHWSNADIDEAKEFASEVNIESEVTDKMLYARLRKQISYLAKTHREIVVMYYYENKTTAEIAKILDMNDNTVRWYLSNIRDTLKERMNMSENLDFRPASLCIGIDGCIEEPGYLRTLEDDLLVQNIALACYKEPLTITEISEKLNVAAAYLEKHIEKMVYMDYLVQQGKKYQTNFFISNGEVEVAKITYGYDYAKPYADRIIEAVMDKKDKLLGVDYFGKGNVNEDYLLWYVLLKVAQEKAYEQMNKKWSQYDIVDYPMRKDGSKYWIIATEYFENEWEGKLDLYRQYHQCCGYKHNAAENVGEIYQADTYFCSSMKYGYRDTDNTAKMIKLIQAAKAIMRVDSTMSDEMNDFEKLYVSEFVKEGYISTKDNKPILNVPMFNEKQWNEMVTIVDEIKHELGEDFLKEYLEGYSIMMGKYIPKNLDRNLKNYHKYAMMGGFDMFAHMIMDAIEGTNDKLKFRIPDENDARYAMTMLVV